MNVIFYILRPIWAKFGTDVRNN